MFKQRFMIPLNPNVWLAGILFICISALSAESPEALRVKVSRIEFLGDVEHGLSGAELSRILVDLGQAEDGLAARGEGRAIRAIRLGSLSDADGGPLTLYGSALQEIVRAVSNAYSKKRIGAVRVQITRSALDRLAKPNSDGVLQLQIVVGRVGSLKTTATAEGDSKIDSAVFEKIIRNSPVKKGDLVQLDEIERYVARLNRHPGRQVDVLLAPGTEPGELILDYRVHENKPWLLFFQASDTGSETTSKWRERFGVTHYDLSGADDVLSLNYITGNFDDVHYVSGSYQRPFAKLADIRAKLFGSFSTYEASDVGLFNIRFEGESKSLGLEFAKTVFQRDELFVDFAAAMRYLETEVDNKAAAQVGRTDFLLPAFSLRSECQSRESRCAASLTGEFNLPGVVGTDPNELIELGRVNADRTWTTLNLNLSCSKYIDSSLSKIFGRKVSAGQAHELYMSFRGQWALGRDRIAPSFLQTVGGSYSVRGHDESFLSGDNAGIANFEYRLHVPRLKQANPGWDLIFRPFVDVGRATQNARESFEVNETLVGGGLGAELQYKRNLNLRVDFGWALKDATNGTENVSRGDNELHVSITLLW
jgi:hemolysin activation/secretion protein